MNIATISGSHRPKSQSLQVALKVKSHLERKYHDIDTTIIDLGGNPFPLWDEEQSDESSEKWTNLWQHFSVQLNKADAFIVISPDWGGMVPAGLKNFFLLCSKQELSHKPALIISISAGLGGSYPVAELRMSSYKNNHLCYIPEHIVIRKVNEILNQWENIDSKETGLLKKRLDYALSLLHEYAKVFKCIRASGVIDHKNFPYGM